MTIYYTFSSINLTHAVSYFVCRLTCILQYMRIRFNLPYQSWSNVQVSSFAVTAVSAWTGRKSVISPSTARTEVMKIPARAVRWNKLCRSFFVLCSNFYWNDELQMYRQIRSQFFPPKTNKQKTKQNKTNNLSLETDLSFLITLEAIVFFLLKITNGDFSRTGP